MIYLFENATGFFLFKLNDKIQKINSYDFKNNTELLETYKSLESNILPENLKIFLNNVFDNNNTMLGVRDNRLVNLIMDACKIPTKFVQDCTFKIILQEMEKFSTQNNLSKTLYLSHKMSLNKLKMNTDKLDFMVTQSINLLLDIDKDINLHCMRIREWYGFHFPELSLLIDDNLMYIKIVSLIKNKKNINIENIKLFDNIIEDENLINKIISLSKNSMGTEISDEDVQNIVNDCTSIIRNFEYRNNLSNYIKEKMAEIAPNLTNLVGDFMGARLISKAGSLNDLSKYPASTVQLLGSEKSLFQALKNKSNTPKYGIIFESSLLGQVPIEYKGKVARSLASKISLCAKLDTYNCSNKKDTGEFGKECRIKIINRIRNLENSSKPKKKVQKKSKFFLNIENKYDDRKDVKKKDNIKNDDNIKKQEEDDFVKRIKKD